MSLRLEQVVTGSYKQNCFVAASAAGEALIVDPGSDAGAIAALIDDNGWRPLAVIATHAHFDHVGAVAPVMERYGIPFYLHHDDKVMLRRMNLFKMVVEPGEALKVPDVSHDLAEGPDEFSIGDFHIRVVATPGHTPGGVCFVIDGHIFSGDTILAQGVGRTDLPGGDAAALAISLETLSRLDPALLACPGHGAPTPLGVLLDMAKKAGIYGT